jgi:peptidoglycan L-alanyl-D-glutamate endopeptidase CwlK
MSLIGCHPQFNNLIFKLLNLCILEGLNVGVVAGLRSFEEQDKIYAQGRTAPGKIVTNAPPGFSWHNYGIAADITFKDEKGKFVWRDSDRWDMLGILGKRVGLEWGGDWKKPDRPHFQFTNGVSIREALRLHKAGGIDAVWNKIFP